MRPRLLAINLIVILCHDVIDHEILNVFVGCLGKRLSEEPEKCHEDQEFYHVDSPFIGPVIRSPGGRCYGDL